MNWRTTTHMALGLLLLSGCEANDLEGAPEPQDATQADLISDVSGASHTSGCVSLGCDDGLSCTIDSCDTDTGQCSWDLLPQSCVIAGACIVGGAAHMDDECLVCDAAQSPYAWTSLEECGEVVPPPPSPGDPCDDEDPCTHDDAWGDGACSGVATECPGDGPCLVGLCDPSSAELCVLVPAQGPCEGADACAQPGTCVEGVCLSPGSVECDDDNACTIDHCDALAGCVHLPKQSPCCVGTENLCEDDNPCTDDSCDPATAACEYLPNAEPCDDGDPCTVSNVCGQGACQGLPKDCDDLNPCTDDYCSADSGCITADLDGVPCDDLLECSTGDACVQGACVADTSQCVCELDGPMDAVRVVALALGQGGHLGEALDIDADESTCAPASDCSGGYNNALGLISAFANEALQDAVDNGDLLLVASFDGAESGTFDLGIYQAEAVDDDCDPTTTSCELLLDPESVESGTCEPLINLAASLTGDQVQAGGPGFYFPFSLPLSAGANLDVILHDTQIQGTVTEDNDQITTFHGVVGGAIPKAALTAAIADLPDEGLPVDKVLIEAVIAAIEADIDTDGDGVGDACSIGFKLDGVDAVVSGFAD